MIDDGYEAHYAFEDWGDNPRRIHWHLGFSGLIHQQVLMVEESVKAGFGEFVETRESILYIANGLKSICTVYEGLLEADEPLTIGFSIGGSRGRRLITYGAPMHSYVSQIDDIRYEKQYTLADRRAGMVDHVAEIAAFIFERFNQPSPDKAEARRLAQSLYDRRL